jgi:hypothetical protein
VGGNVWLDTDRPHAALVVGKRGTGKSHTLGVLAEGVADANGVTPIVLDTMGEFSGLVTGNSHSGGHEKYRGTVVRNPTVQANALPARAWPSLVGLDPTSAAGGIVWHVAAETETLDEAVEKLCVSEKSPDGLSADVRRVAVNHLQRAVGWSVFGSGGLTPTELLADGTPTVVDCSGVPPEATNAICRVLARDCYEACLTNDYETCLADGHQSSTDDHETCLADGHQSSTDDHHLPWLFIDEAHVLFDGVAAPALRRLFTQGRTPGVSVVCATQRPAALPDVATSQADFLLAHALTSEADIEQLRATRPTFLDGAFRGRLPRERGTALVVDDTSESASVVRVRDRRTPHGGETPRARDVTATEERNTNRGGDVETDE